MSHDETINLIIEDSDPESCNIKNGVHHLKGPVIVDINGVCWYCKGELHNDKAPSFIDNHGDKFWFHHGKMHRDNGPAVVYANGDQKWYQYGKIHRDNGPAVIRVDGSQEWFIFGLRHRTNGPAIIYKNSENQFIKEWWTDGVLIDTQSVNQYS